MDLFGNGSTEMWETGSSPESHENEERNRVFFFNHLGEILKN